MNSQSRAYHPVVLGVSMAATWTWAVSIVVGMAFLQDRGVLPFALWATANCLAIPVFGLVIRRWPVLWELVQHRLYRLVMGAYLFPVVWVNLQGLYEIAGRADLFGDTALRVGVLALGLAIVLVIGVSGLRWSILSDQAQWGFLMLGLPLALGVALATPGREAPELFLGLANVWTWGLWGGLILLASPFIDPMQYQRARHARSMAPFWIAGAAFTVYMALLATIGALALNLGTVLLLAFLILMASTSTTDSAASATQYVTGNRWSGVVLGIAAVVSWPVVVKVGVLGLWAAYGSGLVGVVAVLFITTAWRQLRGREEVNVHDLAEV